MSKEQIWWNYGMGNRFASGWKVGCFFRPSSWLQRMRTVDNGLWMITKVTIHTWFLLVVSVGQRLCIGFLCFKSKFHNLFAFLIGTFLDKKVHKIQERFHWIISIVNSHELTQAKWIARSVVFCKERQSLTVLLFSCS